MKYLNRANQQLIWSISTINNVFNNMMQKVFGEVGCMTFALSKPDNRLWIHNNYHLYLCDQYITALFSIFLGKTNIKISRNLGTLLRDQILWPPYPILIYGMNFTLATTFHMNTLRNLNSQAAAGHMRYEPGHFWSKTHTMAMHD